MDEPLPESEELIHLRQRILALEAAQRQINEFLATLAHELRNPLAPIRSAVSLDADGGLERVHAGVVWDRHQPAGHPSHPFGGRPAGRQPTLVAVTGYGQDEDRRLSREAGFDHHLTKPVDPAKLQDLLAAVPVTS